MTQRPSRTQIRALIERWEAVHEGDLDGVVANHSSDIVMFDVPPPNDGVRGIDAYRATWPPFFEWQRQGAVFDIVSVEVTAATRSPSPMPFSAAALRTNWRRTRTIAFGSPSACGGTTAETVAPSTFLPVTVSSNDAPEQRRPEA